MSILASFNPQAVYADGCMPMQEFRFDVDHRSAEEVYIDILIKMDTSNDNYTEFNEEVGQSYNINRDSEIVTYNQDGFLSYSFHFNHANCDLAIVSDKSNQFAVNDFEYICKHCKYFKVVTLDCNGSIVNISKEYELIKSNVYYITTRLVTYDVEKNILVGLKEKESFIDIVRGLIEFFLIKWLPPLLITVIIEVLIALLFRLDSIKKLVLLNISTNLPLSFI